MDSEKISRLRQKLEEAFPNVASEERENMLELLVNVHGATDVYYQTINEKVTRVGVLLGSTKMKLYYSNEDDVAFSLGE